MTGDRQLRVLITQTAPAGGVLCRFLRDSGVQALWYPAILIQAEANPIPPPPFDLGIFTSRHAVEHAPAALWDMLVATQLAAVGRTSAQLLRKHTEQDVLQPQCGAGVEQLWSKLGVSPNQRILIVKGTGGRQWLQRQLAAAGANGIEFNVYRRVTHPELPQQLHRLLASAMPQAMVVTSNSGLDNVLDAIRPNNLNQLLQLALVVVSERGKAHAVRRGFKGPIVIASSIEAPDLLAAIIEATQT